jgi:hypothetical protein
MKFTPNRILQHIPPLPTCLLPTALRKVHKQIDHELLTHRLLRQHLQLLRRQPRSSGLNRNLPMRAVLA